MDIQLTKLILRSSWKFLFPSVKVLKVSAAPLLVHPKHSADMLLRVHSNKNSMHPFSSRQTRNNVGCDMLVNRLEEVLSLIV